jgi:phosphoribosyl-ATP pyrophosphohydrolase/phosphoribosyl-AMP cyclohydrolase
LNRSLAVEDVRFGADGLAAAVVQDAENGSVLMIGWMDREALEATLSTGDVHFHSRSRGRLWRKGETSGNTLRLSSLALDCDDDAILVRAIPSGPTCHRGTTTCFDQVSDAGAASVANPGFAWLDRLWVTISERVRDKPAGSYTAMLAEGGPDATGRKVVEEATEVLIAAKDDASAEATEGDREASGDALANELADLIFHALVVAAERALDARRVVEVLRSRHRPT